MEKWNKDNPLKVFEAFAGYGSQSLALRRVKARINAQFGYSNGLNPDIEGFDFKVVGISRLTLMLSRRTKLYTETVLTMVTSVRLIGRKCRTLICLPIHFHARTFQTPDCRKVCQKAVVQDQDFFGSAGRQLRQRCRSIC